MMHNSAMQNTNTTTNNPATAAVHRFKFAGKEGVTKEAVFMMPTGAQILGAEFSKTSGPVIFALVNAEAAEDDMEPRRFILVATGEPFTGTGARFIKTLTTGGPSLHVFEIQA